MLWNRNFTSLAAANVFFHAAVYMQFPVLHRWMTDVWGYTGVEAACMAVVFGLSLFVPGVFNSYLVDTFSRKRVCVWSMIVLGLATVAYTGVSSSWQILVLRILQGGAFGIALMSTGSTLAIDVASSHQRDRANRAFTWSGIVGMLVGILIGLTSVPHRGFEFLFSYSAALLVPAIALIGSVKVCFRAPLDLPLCSFDRFLLFRAIPPGVNMMAVPLVIGMIFVSVSDIYFYLCMGLGFLLYLLVREIVKRSVDGRIQVGIGQVLLIAGLAVLHSRVGVYPFWVSGALIGLGTGFSIGQFLQLMISLPLHCERGTGYHTYRLSWELALACGILLGVYLQAQGGDLFLTESLITVAGLFMADDKKIIFSMVGVSKSFQNNKQVLKDIYLSFFYGAKIGIIGLNGAGKSTLLKIIAGLDKSYQGEVVFSPGYSVGYLAQEPYLDDTKTVKEVVMEGVQATVDALAEYEEINQKFGLPEYYEDPEKMDALFARQAELQDIIDATDAWNLDSKLERAMDALRCPPEDQPVKHLSGGERRRVALCRLLLQKPDILLLDEPTNHLDAESIDWLEQHLQQYEGTVIAVTHDRYFLDHVAGWILELDRGEGIPWKGNYSSWLEQKTKRMEMEEKVASKRRKTLERELEWVRMAPEKEEKLEIFIPNGPRLGNKVIEAKHVAKAYGDKLLFDDLNFMLPPNGIVGVIGPNGAGKTTLFRLIMGIEQPDKGDFEVGETVKIAYVDQQHKDIDPNKTVYQVVSGGNELLRMGNRDVNARAYLSRFNFSGSDQEKLCGKLSGGERNRLHLAMALKEEGNVLLLDEPTNDIDVNTLRALEEGLEDFAGCAVVISHDRWFLDRICTHILAFEGNSEVFFFEGSYTEYEENKMKRMGNVEPKRVRYRKLMED